MAVLCYACGEATIDVPRGHRGGLLPRHRTKDHVPPSGIFLEPLPSNLITVPCCNECNRKFSGFDERFRMFVAMDVSRNAAGHRILSEKVFGSTMAKARQPDFVSFIASSLGDGRTRDGAEQVTTFAVPAAEIFPGVIRIAKGLLAHFHPTYDYSKDEFTVLDIHSATLQRDDREIQLKMLREIATKTEIDKRGNNDEFRFWRKLETHRGVWLLLFYGAVAFVVLHSRRGESFEQ